MISVSSYNLLLFWCGGFQKKETRLFRRKAGFLPAHFLSCIKDASLELSV